jgi:hypothetical protein
MRHAVRVLLCYAVTPDRAAHGPPGRLGMALRTAVGMICVVLHASRTWWWPSFWRP